MTPTINKILSKRLFFEKNKLSTIPLIPASLPLPTKKIITAIPINIPPRKAGIGVKLIMFNLKLFYFLTRRIFYS